MKKISEIEKNIFSLNGSKIEYSCLIENGIQFFNFKDFNKIFGKYSPCKLLYTLTECKVPENCFYAYYFIPTEKPENYNMFYKYDTGMIPTEFLVFIGSSDKTTAEYVVPIFPPYIDAQISDKLFSKILK